MCRAWKTGDVSADFGQEDLDGALADARDRVQALDLVLKRAQPLGDLLAQVIDQVVQPVEVGELVREQEALVRANLASQCALELRQLGAQTALGQIGQGRCVGGALDEGFEHQPPRAAQDVAGHAAQLDPSAFEGLLKAVALGRTFPNQRGPIAGQLAQLALGQVGHEARPQQAVAQEVGDPFTIPHVGLAAGHLLDVLRIDQQ